MINMDRTISMDNYYFAPLNKLLNNSIVWCFFKTKRIYKAFPEEWILSFVEMITSNTQDEMEYGFEIMGIEKC